MSNNSLSEVAPSLEFGIPRGNTVALVGDPGTGKTTFLLTYVTCGMVNDRVVSLQSSPDALPIEAANRLNELMKPTLKGNGAASELTLRCFVSLESNLPRLLANHGVLLSGCTGTGDQFVFIDATAFVSGRLEDRLRYPKLQSLDHPSGQKAWDDATFELTLGGYGLNDEKHFGLYFQAKGTDTKPPERIEQIEDGAGPFVDTPNARRCFDLVMRPIPDPLQRVRLLKDLLVVLFARFSDHNSCILAIDSLSALLGARAGTADAEPASQGRRLQILNLVRWLEERQVTTLMACEAAEHRPDRSLGGRALFLGAEERYLASGVIQLQYHTYRSGDVVRYLRVMKMRGARHDMRPHAYDLEGGRIAWVEPLFGEVGNDR